MATGGLVIGAFCDNVLKGFVSVEAGPFCLSSIHASEDMREKGIGRALFQVVKRWEKDYGVRRSEDISSRACGGRNL